MLSALHLVDLAGRELGEDYSDAENREVAIQQRELSLQLAAFGTVSKSY